MAHRNKNKPITELQQIIKKQALQLAKQEQIINELKQRLVYYENPHTPPSRDSLEWKR